jgi:hypothetical protein
MKLKDITKWADSKVRTIKVMSDICPVPLQFHVRRFVPIPEDSMKRSWMDGKDKKFKETTPFAIANMQTAVKDMQDYVDNNYFNCVKHFVRDTDTLIQETYEFAHQHMKRHMVTSPRLAFVLSPLTRAERRRRTPPNEFFQIVVLNSSHSNFGAYFRSRHFGHGT